MLNIGHGAGEGRKKRGQIATFPTLLTINFSSFKIILLRVTYCLLGRPFPQRVLKKQAGVFREKRREELYTVNAVEVQRRADVQRL